MAIALPWIAAQRQATNQQEATSENQHTLLKSVSLDQ